MARGLSFIFNARTTGAEHLLKGLSQGQPQAAAATAKVKAPQILHYLWLVEVPGLTGKDGQKTYLLTTVYDEQFEPYIEKLVTADFENNGGAFFDNAARNIDGMQDMVPVHQHLSAFTQFIRERDLTQTNLIGTQIAEAYGWNVVTIINELGDGKPSGKQ